MTRQIRIQIDEKDRDRIKNYGKGSVKDGISALLEHADSKEIRVVVETHIIT